VLGRNVYNGAARRQGLADINHTGVPSIDSIPSTRMKLTSLHAKDLAAVKTYRIGAVARTDRDTPVSRTSPSEYTLSNAAIHAGISAFKSSVGPEFHRALQPLRIGFQRGFRRALPGFLGARGLCVNGECTRPIGEKP
jgi:hypothetical protein